MKRLFFISHYPSIILLLLVLTAACTKEVPTAGDRLYERYATRGDLTAAQVKGFHLNDTVKVDVVLLVADDSAAWQELKEELDIRGEEGITSWLGDMERPQQRVKRGADPVWRAMAVHADRTVALYGVETAEQMDALREYQMEKMRNEK